MGGNRVRERGEASAHAAESSAPLSAAELLDVLQAWLALASPRDVQVTLSAASIPSLRMVASADGAGDGRPARVGGALASDDGEPTTVVAVAPVTVGEREVADADRLIEVLAVAERLRAWLDLVAIRARGALVAWSEARARLEVDVSAADAGTRLRVLGHARSSMVDEITLATGWSRAEASARAQVGAEPAARTAPVTSALREGRITWTRARALLEATQVLDDAAAAGVAESVLRPTRDGSAPTMRLVADRARREVARRCPRDQRRERSLRDRRASARIDDHGGTGAFVVTGATERVTAAADRVSGLARRLRELGDQRTIAQLTSDIALDLLLYGRTGVGVGAPEPPYDGSAPDLAFAAGDGSGGLLAGAFAGDPPPASVQVVVPLAALVGATDEPGEIDGWGCLPGPVLRDLALRAGSVWARLVTDPLSGQAVAVSTPSYRPTPAMRRQVRARDHVCRAPGCSRPARTCELDHDIPHAAGGADRAQQPHRQGQQAPRPQDHRRLARPPRPRQRGDRLDGADGSDLPDVPASVRRPGRAALLAGGGGTARAAAGRDRAERR